MSCAFAKVRGHATVLVHLISGIVLLCLLAIDMIAMGYGKAAFRRSDSSHQSESYPRNRGSNHKKNLCTEICCLPLYS
ncbi:MAG: hypothetical protein ABSC47_05810, partial [Terracidiphilus sp.]